MSKKDKRTERKIRKIDTTGLKTIIDGFELDNAGDPTIHVNGRMHPTAIVTVDFGSPAGGVRLTNEQSHELMSAIRNVARDIVGNDHVPLRVLTDTTNGTVFWAGIS